MQKRDSIGHEGLTPVAPRTLNDGLARAEDLFDPELIEEERKLLVALVVPDPGGGEVDA